MRFWSRTRYTRFFRPVGPAGSGRGKPMSRTGNKTGEMTLSDTKVGCEYELLGFDGGGGLRERINSMGLNYGAILRVIANSGHGPVGLEVKQTKLGIGRGMAQKIRVRKVEIGS